MQCGRKSILLGLVGRGKLRHSLHPSPFLHGRSRGEVSRAGALQWDWASSLVTAVPKHHAAPELLRASKQLPKSTGFPKPLTSRLKTHRGIQPCPTTSEQTRLWEAFALQGSKSAEKNASRKMRAKPQACCSILILISWLTSLIWAEKLQKTKGLQTTRGIHCAEKVQGSCPGGGSQARRGN